MNTNFFTADYHFGHVNKKGTGILEYSNRPFSSIEEMDEALIEKWNAKIKKGDRVYYIGDFAFGDPMKYISRLNGYIYFIIGDHDKDLIRSYKTDIVGNGTHIYKNGTSHGFIYKDRILGRKFGLCNIILCHWKMTVWPRSHYNSWHLYAHSHGGLEPVGKSWDVGVDNNNFEPLSLEEIQVIMAGRPDNFNFIKERDRR